MLHQELRYGINTSGMLKNTYLSICPSATWIFKKRTKVIDLIMATQIV